MSNSRKYQRYFKPISKESFSISGTRRSQGRIGQTSHRESCCSSSASEGKSNKTNKGFLLSTVEYPTAIYNTSCNGACNRIVVKDFSPENSSQSVLLQRKKNIQMQQWNNLNGEMGKTCQCATTYHIGGRVITNEPYTKRVAPMSAREYMNTQYLYNNKTEECCD